MKGKWWFILIAMGLTLTGCEKCIYCHNSCKVCRDSHYYVLVQSDILSAQYYQLYIDSLTAPGLGWVCRDTAFNRDKQVCAQDNKANNVLFTQTQAGWTCVDVP